MIYSSIYSNEDIALYPKAIKEAIEYLKSKDFLTMEPGTYVIDGENMYALVMDLETKPAKEKRPETHQDYLDVQFLVTGKERLGFKADVNNDPIVEAKTEQDIYFYDEIENEGYVISTPGNYCVFFPNDIHRPGCMVDEPIVVRKVVIKIHKKLL